jgi:hypothetical protein
MSRGPVSAQAISNLPALAFDKWNEHRKDLANAGLIPFCTLPENDAAMSLLEGELLFSLSDHKTVSQPVVASHLGLVALTPEVTAEIANRDPAPVEVNKRRRTLLKYMYKKIRVEGAVQHTVTYNDGIPGGNGVTMVVQGYHSLKNTGPVPFERNDLILYRIPRSLVDNLISGTPVEPAFHKYNPRRALETFKLTPGEFTQGDLLEIVDPITLLQNHTVFNAARAMHFFDGMPIPINNVQDLEAQAGNDAFMQQLDNRVYAALAFVLAYRSYIDSRVVAVGKTFGASGALGSGVYSPSIGRIVDKLK